MTVPFDRDRPWWLPPEARVAPGWWLAIAAALLLLEYLTGLHNQFPMFYFIPVCLAAWYSGRRTALALGLIIPIAQLMFVVLERQSVHWLTLIAITALRGTVIIVMAMWFARLSEHERALNDEVQTLQGLLPICSFCKSIRNELGEWEHLEKFISKRSETQFSHGICPSCHQIHYADLVERERQRA
jgi:hypothetical protein